MRGLSAVVLAVLTLGVSLAASCSQSRPAERSPNTITFVAAEYAFTGPMEVTSGLTTIVLLNSGKEIHWLEMYRLAEEKDMNDFRRLLQDTRLTGKIPPWLSAVGGPGWIPPQDTSNVTSYLTPGQYVLVCRFPSADRIPHSTKGMVESVRVTDPTKPPDPEPQDDVVLTISDTAFSFSRPLRAGSQTLRVENVGSYRHEVYLFQLAPGKSIQDYRAWEDGGLKGVGPGRPRGGVTPFEPGQRAWFTVFFEPGEYVFGDETWEGPVLFRQVTVR
ncbi:MAG: hypothetical protein ABI037_10040 [Gemmatimonadales bacterium]